MLYGVACETSIGSLFLAGVIPGIMMALFLCFAVYLTAKKEGLGGVKQPFSLSTFFKKMWAAKWAILVPVIILGGIYTGIFTPTEAGAVACIYAVIIALFVDHTLDLKGVLHCASESAVTSATILILIAAAGVSARS